ncbi:MAG TPA: type IV pilus modification protein PilV [Burkholderiales bacterium]
MRGVSLIEVLVALLIMLLGLLGLAGLQTRVTRAEFEAYQRAQALILLHDMVDRIQSNRPAARCYAITGSGGTPWLGTGSSAGVCSGWGTTETRSRAFTDMLEWSQTLEGIGEISAGRNVGAMLGARGCVSFVEATNTYTVAVSWQGNVQTAAPAVGCANGQYGNEALRRTIATSFQFAVLE